MLVCHCHGISDRRIRRAVRSGAVTADQVARSCGAGGSCGGCARAVEEIVDAELGAATSQSAILELEVAPAR